MGASLCLPPRTRRALTSFTRRTPLTTAPRRQCSSALTAKAMECPLRLLLDGDADSGGFRGGAGSAAAPPLVSFRKIHGLPISKTVRTADSTIVIITNFYLAASSHEIFLTVGGREGMKGLGALQRHQLPHPLPPCKNPGSATGRRRDPKAKCYGT